MPRFRPFIMESSSAAPVLVDVVKNVNGSRYISREELNDNLPSCDFFDLKEMVESSDVRLDPVNPILFPVRSVNFDLSETSSETSSSSEGNSNPVENKGVNDNA